MLFKLVLIVLEGELTSRSARVKHYLLSVYRRLCIVLTANIADRVSTLRLRLCFLLISPPSAEQLGATDLFRKFADFQAAIGQVGNQSCLFHVQIHISGVSRLVVQDKVPPDATSRD